MQNSNNPYSAQQIEKNGSKTIRPLGMPMLSQQQWVEKLHKSKYLEHDADFYNQGDLVSELENRVAKILNKPAALFFTKGMVAQFAALKTAEAIKDSNKIIIHPMSHLGWDEKDAYKELLGLEGSLIGDSTGPFSSQQLSKIEQSVSSLCVELPLRRTGFKLPPFEELEKMRDWSRTHNVHFHMDGARLWESTNFYGKSEAEIAKLFDSVYVSLYKGIGGMGGAILAGENKFIEQCKTWRSRFGGDSFTAFPLVVSALDGLDNQYQRIPSFVERAKRIAQSLKQFDELDINPPQTNGFFIFLSGDIEVLSEKARALNQQFELQLFSQINRYPDTEKLMIEIQIGANHEAISDQEIEAYFKALLEN